MAPKAPEVPTAQLCSVNYPIPSSCDLYEWSGGQLHLVNVFPGNSVVASKSVIGAGFLLGIGSNFEEAPNVGNAISADGRFVFFSTQQVGHVYARIDGERTLAVPGPGSCREVSKR